MVPRAVLMKSGLVSINTAKQINAAHSKTIVNAARPMSYLSKTSHSSVKRPIDKNTTFKNSNIDQRVNTISGKKINTARPKAVVNTVKANSFNAVKALACWVWKPKTKVLDHVMNNAQRVNHQNFAKKTHPYAKKNMVPRAVLMKSDLVSINTARQVNAAHSKITVNAARPMSYLSKTTHLTVKRPIDKNTTFKNSNIDQRVNTISGKKFNTARPKAVVNTVKGNSFNAVKALACWV
ncbi:hypothetical protein Tco_0916759 [Tanacetum coccineum]